MKIAHQRTTGKKPVRSRNGALRRMAGRLSHFLMTSCVALIMLHGDSCLESSALFAEEPEFQILFNGENLKGWRGNESLWSVSEGVIVGVTAADHPLKSNTFLVWEGDEQGNEITDFEFRCEIRFEGNNSGVQYRSEFLDEAQLSLKGYQADMHPKLKYMGMMYGEATGRGIISEGGRRVQIDSEGQTTVKGNLVPFEGPAEGEWNELRIIAVNNRMIHQVNGLTTVDITDDHPEARRSGLIGLQLHHGPPMKVEFRNLRIRRLEEQDGVKAIEDAVRTTQVLKVENQ